MRDHRNDHCFSSIHYNFVKERQDNKFLTFIYDNPVGAVFQRIFVSKPVTNLLGWFYDSKLSLRMLPKFITKNQIDMSLFQEQQYKSFNDFFVRAKKNISFPLDASLFCSPCDGYLSVYKINEEQIFRVKGLEYDLVELLHSHSLSKLYRNGYAFIFRLVPRHYHRYHYFDDGAFIVRKKIQGCYHTVRPVALLKKQVFLENTREYTILNTENFGNALYMEVGALGVGKIVNHYKKEFRRGEEKGMFLFGGSTIIVLVEENLLEEPTELILKTDQGYEAVVECGDVLAKKNMDNLT